MEHANQASDLMLHQIFELEKQVALLNKASQHYHKLCQTAQAEGHQLSVKVAELSSMVGTSASCHSALQFTAIMFTYMCCMVALLSPHQDTAWPRPTLCTSVNLKECLVTEI